MASIGGQCAPDPTEPSVHKGPVPATGLTVLLEPAKPTLDILFVHGFTGHPERTWSSKKAHPSRNIDESDEPPTKIRRLDLFPKKAPTKETTSSDVYWPRDLVPSTVPHARVLTYGYDTRIRHKAGSDINKDTLCDIAWNLLVALEGRRRDDPSRPILFIVHSLGGIVVKEMLRRARTCQHGQAHLHSVFQSTVGFIFFGTPHAGADPRSFLHKVVEKVILAAQFTVNEHIVQTLLPSSERLKELRDVFGPMAQEQNWVIHSFQEQFGVRVLADRKVVDDTSSYLNLPSVEVTEHIGRNHMEMCRFAGPDENEYRKVAAALTRITAARPKQLVPVPARATASPSEEFRPRHTQELTEEQKQALLDSLRFDQIDARHMTIKAAHAKTCRWLLQKSEYLDWCDPGKLAEHNGFLWIKGKPGAGKSTLMKFALANTRRKAKEEIVLSFFFNARGDDLEKSTSGLFRSLLVQLMEQLSPTKIRVSTLGSLMWQRNGEWALESLKSLFEEAVLSLRDASLICFVDALDECDDRQIRDMVYFFERLGEQTVEAAIPFRVCFASRHYPHITMSKEHNLILEGQEGHDQDISNYLSANLRIKHTKLKEQIRADVQARASGVFMWVVLVTDILNIDSDSGRIHRLRKRVQELPADLHELFRSILTRDTSNREELLLCIQWVLFARKPLTPTELYFAVLSGVDPDVLLEWDRDATTSETVARYLLDSSKGLAEITKSKKPTVQFIHESVRDFLLKENGLREIWSDLGDDFQSASHDALKKCCLNCICRGVIGVDIPDPLPKASSTEAARLRQEVGKANPFLEYATHNVLDHAEAAVKGGPGQEEFLNTFPLNGLMRWQNIFEKHEVRRFKPGPSLLYVLAERGLVGLINLLPPTLDCLAVEDQRYGFPVLAASVGGHQQALQLMLERISATLPPSSPFHKRCRDFFRSPNKGTKVFSPLRQGTRKSFDNYLFKYGTYELFVLLLFTGKVATKVGLGLDIMRRSLQESKGERTTTVMPDLQAATLLPDLQAATLLPDYWPGVLLDPTTKLLCSALWLHHPATVKHLLAAHLHNGLSATSYRVILQQRISLQDRSLEGVLDTLARAGVPNVVCPVRNGEHLIAGDFTQTEAVVALLQSGAYLEATNEARDMALVTLIAHGDGQATSVLSARGSSLEARDERHSTPLINAAQRGQPMVINALLRLGADIEANTPHNNDNNTALWAAARGRYDNCVELLCSRGANTETRDGMGATPLLFAAEKNDIHLAVSLLKWGACVHAVNCRGLTPLMFWSMCNRYPDRPEFAHLLLNGGADIDARDRHGQSALIWAVKRDQFQHVQLLLNAGADIHAKDKDGKSALIWATRLNIVELLLDRGADIHGKDKSGRSAWSWAASSDPARRAIRLLLERGANPEEMDWKAMKRLRGENPEALDGGDDHEPLNEEDGKNNRLDMDWKKMKWLYRENPEALDGGDDHEPLNEEDGKNNRLDTPTVCEVCVRRRFAAMAEKAAAEKAAAEAAAAEAAAAETAVLTDGMGEFHETEQLDGTGVLDRMDESDGTGSDGL